MYCRFFSIVIDGIAVYIVIVVRVVVDVSQFEVWSQSLIFAVGEGIICIYIQFIMYAVVRLIVNFYVVAQLVVIIRLEQIRNVAVRSYVISIIQFEVVIGF